MSPLERSLLTQVCDHAGRGWSCRIRAVAVESIVAQRSLPTTTTTTLWSLLPEPVQRRMQAAVKGSAGVRLSVSECLDVQARHWEIQQSGEAS